MRSGIFFASFLNQRNVIQFLLAVVFAISLGKPSFAGINVEQGVPAGFEQLDAPRPTSVTVYYGGDLIGTFQAHSTPSTLRFDQGDKIVNAISNIADKQTVGAALTKPLPTNQDALCGPHRPEQCGVLHPEVAGIIFDENHLSAELFINPTFLSIVDENATRYLPLPDRHFSSVYNLNGAVAGVNSETPNYSLGYQSTYSFGEARVDSQSDISNKGLRFDTVAAKIDRNGWNGTTGLFRSRSMQLISDHDIAGVGVSTSSRTMLDNHKSEGNDVIVYLPRRSFVSLYREGRLYSSHAYEAGNQKIDTTELPDGAYNVTLKIQEADGEAREETRFFSKTQNIPSPGSPLYYAEAGLIRKQASEDSTMPTVTGLPLVHAGTVQRLGDNIAGGIGLLGVMDRAATEGSLFWMHQNSQISTTLLASTRGDVGAQLGYLYANDKFSLSSDLRKVLMSNKAMPGDDTLIRNLTQASLTTSYSVIPELILGLRLSYAKEDDMLTTTSLGPYAQWNIWQEGESTVSLNADAARTGHENQGNIFLRFSRRFGNYGVTGSGGSSLGQGGAGPSGNVHVWHDETSPGENLLLAGGLDGNAQTKTVSTDARWHNNVGQMEGGIQKAFGQINSPLSYGGNFALNAAQLADEISVGGSENAKSAVVIKTTGDANTLMKIFVNNVPQSSVQVGSQQVIYLSAFHQYNIRLAPEKGGLYDYDSSDHMVTLYPGNVTKLEWSVNKFYVVAAQIRTPSNQPLQNAALQESHALVATDDKGRIQAELSKPTILTFLAASGDKCQVHLPQSVTPIHGVLLYKEPVICNPIVSTVSQ